MLPEVNNFFLQIHNFTSGQLRQPDAGLGDLQLPVEVKIPPLKSGVTAMEFRAGWISETAFLSHPVSNANVFRDYTPEAYAKAVTPKTKILYVETPANPTLAVVDLAAIAALAKQAKRFRAQLLQPAPHAPGLLELVMFRMGRNNVRIELDEQVVDLESDQRGHHVFHGVDARTLRSRGRSTA